MSQTLPTPARSEGRICFSILWFKTELEAKAYAEYVYQCGRTYNGGYFHGMPCGRESQYDYEEDGVKYYAVTE